MKLVRLVMIASILLPPLPAAAQFGPLWRSKTGLTQRDSDLLAASVDRLNRLPNLSVGSEDSWRNAASHSSGVNVVRQIFQDGNLTCHRIHHEITVKGRQPPQVYNLNWCLIGGTWKIKS